MVNNEKHKKTIGEFEKKVFDYFTKNRHDVAIKQIFKGLNLKIGDLNLLEYDTLVKKGWLKRVKL